jgi:hypothetical protein
METPLGRRRCQPIRGRATPCILSATLHLISGAPAEHANFLAAKIVAYATAFLDGRDDAKNLGRNAALRDDASCWPPPTTAGARHFRSGADADRQP